MRNAPTKNGQGAKKGACNAFVAIKAAVVKVFVVVAHLGHAGGAR